MLSTLLLCSLLCATLCSAAPTWPQNYVVTEVGTGRQAWVDSTKLWARIQLSANLNQIWACFELGCVRYYIDTNQPPSNVCQTAVFMKDQFWNRIYWYSGWGSITRTFQTGLEGYEQTGPKTWVHKDSNRCGPYITQWNLTDAGLPSSWLSTARIDEAGCVPMTQTYHYDFQPQDPKVTDFQDVIFKNCANI